MKANAITKAFRIFGVLTCILILISCQSNAQNSTELPAHFSPLNPNRPDILDLEVPEGTTALKTRRIIYNRVEKKYIAQDIVTTKLNDAGMVTNIHKKSLAEIGKYEIENRTYDALNRVIKKERFFIENKDTIALISKISYSGSNPLIAKWETDNDVFLEKMYVDKQGMVTKRETMETLDAKESIYRIETYNPEMQKGTFTNNYPEGGSEIFNITYLNGKMVSEVALDPNSDFKLQHISRDTLGNIIRTHKKYAENAVETPSSKKNYIT